MKGLTDFFDLSGKRVVITGAANGIGAAVARRFAEAGVSLVLVDRDVDGLEKLRHVLTPFGVDVQTKVVDLEHKSEIDSFWEQQEEKVDFLVNNAGVYPFRPFLEVQPDFLEKVMAINLYSVLWMCQSFIRQLEGKEGVVVNMGSIEAILPFKKDLSQYSLAKVGVITLTRDLAREFAEQGVRVNAILPGGILTEGTREAAKKAVGNFDFRLLLDAYNFKQRIPAQRLGNPDEVATMVVVLCSDLASYMHGALIPIDGGFLAS
jgi:NAD(P)-dependent dehydrogenase (short-subunit alcohol dehydrogenase family)